LQWKEEGEGTAIVCVHGLGGSSNTWTPLMPALARHRVIRIDLPGSGRSQRVEGPLSIERYVAAVLEVCTRLDVKRAHWLGHSMGTIVVQHVAATQPMLVARHCAVRSTDHTARCRPHRDQGARSQGTRRRARHARDHAGAAECRDIGRYSHPPAAGGRVRARKPDAPGR
jgi:pimeloyl-ACP methyl ester carboxylesterase